MKTRKSLIRIKLTLFLPYLLLLSLLLLAGFLNGSPFIFGDGYGYYHVSHNLVTYGGFTTDVKPEYLSYAAHAVTNFNNKYVTVYSSGPSILMWPFMVVSNILNNSHIGTIYNDYYKSFNGHSFYDGLFFLLGSIFYTWLSLILIFKSLRILKFSKKRSSLVTAIVAISSYLFIYTYQFIGYSHIYEVFCISLLIWGFLNFINKSKLIYLILVGISSGLIVLVRPIDLVLLIPIFIYFLSKSQFKNILIYILSASPFTLIFFFYNFVSYGSPISTGYSTLWGATGFDFNKLNTFELLFSDIRGWFIWSPLLIFSLIGLIFISRRSIKNFIIYLLPVLILVFSYSFWSNWWGGDSAGQRFFLVLIPYCAIGLSYFIDLIETQKNIIKRISILAILVLVIYSSLINILYRITPTSKLYSNYVTYGFVSPDKFEVPKEERFSALDIYKYQYIELKNSKSLKDYLNKIVNSFNGGRSLILLSLGLTQPIVKFESVRAQVFNINLIPSNLNKEVRDTFYIEIEDKFKILTHQIIKLQGIDFNIYQNILVDCSNTFEKCKVPKQLKSGEISSSNDLSQNINQDNSMNVINIGLDSSISVKVLSDSNIKISDKI